MRKMTAIATGLALLAPTVASAQPTQSFRFDHYPTGPHVYDFPDRDPQADLAFMEQRRREQEAVRHHNNSFDPFGGADTIAVGNWQQYYMVLGDGSNANLINKSPQSDWGTQTATSNENLNSTQTQNNTTDFTGDFSGMTNVQQGGASTCGTTCGGGSAPSWSWGGN
jgi:hypothetical protein